MRVETFYSYKRYRYFVLNLVLILILGVFYLIDNPIGGPSGGTPLGYTYGAIATAGILYLMWYGIRKRSYNSRYTTLKGCLSAHVWLGISLLLIVPLHAGFSFGYNVHTLTYLLLCLVVGSGIWGALRYVDLAPQIKSHRGGGTIKKHIEQIRLLSGDIDDLLRDKSDRLLDLKNKINLEFYPSILNCLFGKLATDIDSKQTAELVEHLSEKDKPEALKLISMVGKKRELIAEVQQEVAILTKLKFWLYIHLPISVALLVALAIHIFSVFYYW